jgi:hypothetical protein
MKSIGISLIVGIIGVLLSLVVRAVFEIVRSRREKPAYLAAAGSMGLNYAEDVATDSLPRKDEFRLFSGKDAEHIPFMMSGAFDGVDVRIPPPQRMAPRAGKTVSRPHLQI